jgi:hypothetical protein
MVALSWALKWESLAPGVGAQLQIELGPAERSVGLAFGGLVHHIHQQTAGALGALGAGVAVRVDQRHKGEELGIGFGGIGFPGQTALVRPDRIGLIVGKEFGVVVDQRLIIGDQQPLAVHRVARHRPRTQTGQIVLGEPQARVVGHGRGLGNGLVQRGRGAEEEACEKCQYDEFYTQSRKAGHSVLQLGIYGRVSIIIRPFPAVHRLFGPQKSVFDHTFWMCIK